jgi:hypothetical protein
MKMPRTKKLRTKKDETNTFDEKYQNSSYSKKDEKSDLKVIVDKKIREGTTYGIIVDEN